MTIEKRYFGDTKNGEKVDCYTLTDSDASVEILTLGGIVRSLVIPTSEGLRDVAQGFDDVAGYEEQKGFIGALIGRVANRIGNAVFSLGGNEYKLDKNDGENSLHGGFNGYDKQIWEANAKSDGLWLTLQSPDMDGGFPGNLSVKVRYALEDYSLTIEYYAECDADTPINLTNHCYFNLGGHDSGGIENHKIQIFSDSITPIDDTLIPTGEKLDVTGTPFDLRTPKIIGEGLSSNHPQITFGGGYDHNFVLASEPCREMSPAAVLEYGGVKMTCLTTKPGIQFYSGNFLLAENGKQGAVYPKRSGLCLETQFWPDSVNKPEFPNSLLQKGEIYHHITVYKFEYLHKQ